MKKIYFIIWTVVVATMFVSCERDEEARLSTISVSSETFAPSYNSVLIETRFETTAAASYYKPTLKTVYVQYSTRANFEEYEEALMNGEDYSYTYKVQLSDLQDNTTYYIRYVASNRYSSAMTKEISEFKTCQPSLPTIKIASIFDIWDTHAKTQIALDSDGGVPVIEMGICWDTQTAPVFEKNKLAIKDTSSILNITSLLPNTKYYLRAYAKNKIGVAYSEETTLTTCSLPEVKTDEITDVQVTTALLNGLLVFNGNDTSTIKGFCWGDNPLPTINNNQKQVTTSSNNFTYQVSDLKDETKYYVRAYAKNKIGIVYGEEKFFTTKKKALGFDGNPNTRGFYTPSEAIAAVDAGMIAKDDSIKVGGIISRWFPKSAGFDKYRSVTFFVMDPITGQEHEFEFYNCYSLDKDYFATFEYTDEMNAICVDVDGREFHLGDTVVGAGKYTIYNGTHELNTNCYLIDWRPVSTTGQRYLPTVTTSSATNISYTSASVGGNVTSAGGATVTERGVVYSTSQSPTISNTKVKSGTGMGAYTCNLTNLQAETTYYARAYAVNNKGTAFGEQVSFTTKAYALPTVTTSSATNITYTSAIVGGNVTSDGGASVTERGVVYSTSQNPTTSNSKKVSGSGIGSFSISLTGLIDGTTYYVRAYAINKKGTAYGEQTSFTTKAYALPTVTTSSATNISYTSAIVGGNVTSDGGATVTERGVVYSTSQYPTISNSKIVSGSGTGAFSCSLSNLQAGTTYYIRAYAINKKGTAYGEQKPFTLTVKPFSVSSSKKIVFSSGNLQYHPANNKWRFAENQTDYIGEGNRNISSSYNGWLDLYGWSTSATNFGVSTSIDENDYSGSFLDWGSNQIGADAPNTWRTLTDGEWEYLLNNRPNASSLKGVAQVNGVNGLILLPDTWTCPSGVTFKSGFYSYYYGADYYAAYQTFTAEQWSKLESAGAVFLPASGYCRGSDVGGVQDYGSYWAATESSSNRAYCLYFRSAIASTSSNDRYSGLSVRLVKDL